MSGTFKPTEQSEPKRQLRSKRCQRESVRVSGAFARAKYKRGQVRQKPLDHNLRATAPLKHLKSAWQQQPTCQSQARARLQCRKSVIFSFIRSSPRVLAQSTMMAPKPLARARSWASHRSRFSRYAHEQGPPSRQPAADRSVPVVTARPERTSRAPLGWRCRSPPG